ncbi:MULTISPECIES: hypothetical protein [Cupriavidus]|jgi:hypothetical protein|uniref:hypothetical protein n=1 Tax=Cupriavidus TaxID=106589 RepID=UPI000796A789|nr:hypothetical protein [Cupriavidus metallidurans]KWW32427.1 hypothetical protein AU374_06027 [Cupriavidus metallidurans]
MPELTVADALRLAINLLRDAAESGKMPSGIPLDEAGISLHSAAAETLQDSLDSIVEHGSE